MSKTEDKAPHAKSGRRNRKKDPKPDQRMPRPDPLPVPDAEPVLAAAPPVETTVAPPEPAPTAPAEPAPIETAAPSEAGPIDGDPPAEPEPVKPEPVSFQTIANAYGDYTRQSLEDTRSFMEKLSGARSLDKAMEVQSEFARQAYQSFVAQTQRIRGLHSELARQTLKPLEDLMHKTSRDRD